MINKKKQQRSEDLRAYNEENNVDQMEKMEDEELENRLNCSLDSDEKEFIENLSWDTDSDDEDFELDNEIFKLHKEDK